MVKTGLSRNGLATASTLLYRLGWGLGEHPRELVLRASPRLGTRCHGMLGEQQLKNHLSS